MIEDGKKTVLVVEDEGEISNNMLAMLTRKGYRVLHAIDAGGAMKIVHQTPPEVILTDLDLPTLGQLIDELLTQDGLKDLPIAVIDINHPQDPHPHLKILHSFEELDELVSKSGRLGPRPTK